MPPENSECPPWLIGRGERLCAWCFDGHLILVQLDSGALRLYNPSALAVWLLLAEELSAQSLISQLADLYHVAPETVSEGVCALLDEWRELGLVGRENDIYRLTYQIHDASLECEEVSSSATVDRPSCNGSLIEHRITYLITLAVPVAIEIYAADDAQSNAIFQRLCTILDGFPKSKVMCSESSLAISIQGGTVAFSEDGDASRVNADPTEVIGQTLLRLLRLGYPGERIAATIHAAAAFNPATREGVIFPGISGAGKSTLAVALSERGWRYLGDDVVGLSGDGRIMPLPTAASLKPNSWGIFTRHYSALEGLPLITYSGKSAKYLPLATEQDGTSVVPLGRWVLPVFEPEGSLEVEKISPIELLQGLMEAGMGLSGQLSEGEVDGFMSRLYQIPAQRIKYSNLDEVARWLENPV